MFIVNQIKRYSSLCVFSLLGLVLFLLQLLLPLYLKGDLANQFLHLLFSGLMLFLLAAYYYAYQSKQKLRLKAFLLGYAEADLPGVDRQLYRLSSSMVWQFIKAYPLVSVYILHWAISMGRRLAFWAKFKEAIAPTDFFEDVEFLAQKVGSLFHPLTSCFYSPEEEIQVLVNLIYVVLLVVVGFLTSLRIKFTSVRRKVE